MSTTGRWVGLALIVFGGLAALVGAFGDLLIQGERSPTYVDPSTTVYLDPGSYPVDWIGPAKGDVPFPSDLVIRLQVDDGAATWRESSREILLPTGPPEKDQARSPLGVVEVRERSALSIDFDLRTDGNGSPRIVDTQGRPRILVESGTEAPQETRSGPLLIGGTVALFAGVLMWNASRGKHA